MPVPYVSIEDSVKQERLSTLPPQIDGMVHPAIRPS